MVLVTKSSLPLLMLCVFICKILPPSADVVRGYLQNPPFFRWFKILSWIEQYTLNILHATV